MEFEDWLFVSAIVLCFFIIFMQKHIIVEFKEKAISSKAARYNSVDGKFEWVMDENGTK